MAQDQDLLDIALDAAGRAAAFIRAAPRPGDPATWDRKGMSDFVTDVDRGSEQLITDFLSQAVPGCVVMGEEFAPTVTDAAIRWIVDPLDGTTNYLHGYPAYAVSIAGMIDGQLSVAVVSDVARSVTYHATAGGGAWCGDRPLSVSAVTDPAAALIGTGFPFKRPASDDLTTYLDQFSQILTRTSGVRRAGSAALDLAHLAQGRFDGFWELWLEAWDVAAGILLVREAGGVASDLAGQPAPAAAGAIVAGNPTIHSWLLGLLQQK